MFFSPSHARHLIFPFIFFFFYHAHKKQSLPTALLHLIGCDWLCPEAFASFSVTA